MCGFQICGMHVDLHQKVCPQSGGSPLQKCRYLKRRMLSIMLCVNWVCEGAFDDDEWVSERQLPCKKKKWAGSWVAKSVFRAWCSGVCCGFPRPLRLNQTFGRRRNIHREVPRSCGHGDCGSDLHPFWRFAHTTNVYVDNVGCGFVEIGM